MLSKLKFLTEKRLSETAKIFAEGRRSRPGRAPSATLTVSPSAPFGLLSRINHILYNVQARLGFRDDFTLMRSLYLQRLWMLHRRGCGHILCYLRRYPLTRDFLSESRDCANHFRTYRRDGIAIPGSWREHACCRPGETCIWCNLRRKC